MAATLAIVLGLLVIGSLVYGAITQFQRRQAVLAERQAERERTGEAERLRQLHAEREARASDD
jgi:cell division protein FtsL